MYIVLDKDNAIEQLHLKYLLLELDTLEIYGEGTVVSYAVITNEQTTIQDLQIRENLKDLHKGLMRNYHKKDWNFCKQAIEQLTGKFKGEIDTFYSEIGDRIKDLEILDLPDNWTGNIIVNYE